MILDDLRDAIAGADSDAFDGLLNAEDSDSDLNAFSVNALFGMCVLAAAQSHYDGGSIRAYQNPTPGGRESESGRVRPGTRPVALWLTA